MAENIAGRGSEDETGSVPRADGKMSAVERVCGNVKNTAVVIRKQMSLFILRLTPKKSVYTSAVMVYCACAAANPHETGSGTAARQFSAAARLKVYRLIIRMSLGEFPRFLKMEDFFLVVLCCANGDISDLRAVR